MKLDNRQKVIVVLIAIALAYVLWQAYSMFFRNDSVPSVATPRTSQMAPMPGTSSMASQTANPATASPTGATTTAPTSAMSANNEMRAEPAATSTVKPAPKTAVPTQNGFTLEAPSSDYQNQYVELVNQYQLLRMRRMIVDEEANIAAAKERIANIDQKLGQISGNSASVTDATDTSADASNPTGYKLMYIDFQSGQWSATLSKDNRFLEVAIGDNLIDGAKVIQINQQGIVIEKNQNQYLLTFYGTKSLGQVKAVDLDDTLAPNNLFKPNADTSSDTANASSLVKNKNAAIPTTTKNATTSSNLSSSPKTPTKSSEKKSQDASLKSAKQATQNVINSTNNTSNESKAKPNLPAAASQVSLPGIPGADNSSKPKESASQHSSVTTTTTTINKSETPAPTETSSAASLKLTPQQKNTYNALQTMFDEKKSTTSVPAATATTTTKSVTNTSVNPPVATAATANNQVKFSDDEKYLLSVPSSYYVLQIMGSRNNEDLSRLQQQYSLGEQAHSLKTYYQGKSWYILVYGVYKNSQDATAAISKLPSGLQDMKPWVRSVANIHSAIHTGREAQHKSKSTVTRPQKRNNQSDQGIDI